MPRSDISRRLAIPAAAALLMLVAPFLWIATGHYRKITQSRAIQGHVELARAASGFVHELDTRKNLAGLSVS